jgi:predicted DNA-binding transcriptional regulator YafY
MLERDHNISCERKTIYSDIATLQDFGVDIITLPGKNGGYYIGYRNFEPYELKLLIDAVQSSRYLTEKKCRELIEKLCQQCSVHDAGLVRRNVQVSGRVRTMNETIYYNVDAIQEAIASGKQISFRYFDYDIRGQRQYRDKSYIASPYGLCQDNDFCYLLAWSERHGITSYRVDRMSGIEILAESRIPCPELTGAAFTDHANRLFQMFAGDLTNVKLRFHKELTNVVIDRFGHGTMLIPEGDGIHFNFTVPVALSPMFLSWVIGFGDKAQILYPQSAVDACKELCRKALQQY